jgi:hypothetical protein
MTILLATSYVFLLIQDTLTVIWDLSHVDPTPAHNIQFPLVARLFLTIPALILGIASICLMLMGHTWHHPKK